MFTKYDDIEDIKKKILVILDSNILAEIALRALAVNARIALSDTKRDIREDQDVKNTWADELVNKAQKYVHKHSQRGITDYFTQYEFITG